MDASADEIVYSQTPEAARHTADVAFTTYFQAGERLLRALDEHLCRLSDPSVAWRGKAHYRRVLLRARAQWRGADVQAGPRLYEMVGKQGSTSSYA